MNNKIQLIEFQNLLYRHEMYKKIFSNINNEKYLVAEYLFLFNRLKSQKYYLILLKSQSINKQIINIIRYFLNNYKSTIEIRNDLNNFMNSLINN